MESTDFLIAGTSHSDLFEKPVGKLMPRLNEAVISDFVLLDSFDGDLRNSGRVLIETGNRLLLLRDRGVSLSQRGSRNVRFVADLPAGPVREALSDISALRCLMPIASGVLKQTDGFLLDDEGKTRARFDIIELTSATAVTLVRTEPMRGYEKAHARLSAYLRTAAGKLAGGSQDVYRALAPDLQPYIAKPKILFPADEPAIDAATDIVSAYLDVARRNEDGIIADLDTEFLHDYRVALRKIRSVLSLFKGIYSDAQTMALKRGFSDLMAPTGRLRDIDVYLLERDSYFPLLPQSLHGGLNEMFDRIGKSRKAELRKLTRRLQSQAYARQMASLQSLFSDASRLHRGPEAERPVLEYARALIWKRYRKVCKMGRSIDDGTPDELVHELRIHCKKLRYLMEFFAPLFDKQEVKGRISALKALQENLGLFNDYSVQQVALQEALDRAQTSDAAKKLDMAKSVGALIAVLHQRQLEERARVSRSFAEFDSPDVQDSFRSQFQGVMA